MNGIRWIVVVGRTPFPVDMLRYDQAWPAREIDSIIISERGALPKGAEDRCVRLNTLKVPTLDRWAGFGWKVISSNMMDSLPPATRAGIEKNVDALYPNDPRGV
jgi:hypothetical protein